MRFCFRNNSRKILLNYQKEIPYAVEVAVDQYKEEEDILEFLHISLQKKNRRKILLLVIKVAPLKSWYRVSKRY